MKNLEGLEFDDFHQALAAAKILGCLVSADPEDPNHFSLIQRPYVNPWPIGSSVSCVSTSPPTVPVQRYAPLPFNVTHSF